LEPAAYFLVYVCTPFMHASNIPTPCRDFYYPQPVQVLPCLLNLSVIGKGTTTGTPYSNLIPIANEALPAKDSLGPRYSDQILLYPSFNDTDHSRDVALPLRTYIPSASQPISGSLSVTAEFHLQLPVLVCNTSIPRAATYTHTVWRKRHEENHSLI
jgi:hypothetical protein